MITLCYMKSGPVLPHTFMLADINQHTSHAIPTTVTGMFTEWMIDYWSQNVSRRLEIRSSWRYTISCLLQLLLFDTCWKYQC